MIEDDPPVKGGREGGKGKSFPSRESFSRFRKNAFERFVSFLSGECRCRSLARSLALFLSLARRADSRSLSLPPRFLSNFLFEIVEMVEILEND